MPGIRSRFLAAALALHAGGGVPAQSPSATTVAPEPILIRSLLVVERQGRGGRVPIVTDAVELALARGTWRSPSAGDAVGDAAGAPGGRRRTWRVLEAADDGWFQDPALRGGWAVATLELDAARTMLLDARGHRHVCVNGVPRGGDVYAAGYLRLPVALRAGRNELLFKGGRGRLHATLTAAPTSVFFEARDRTLPDLIRGDTEEVWLGVPLTNATAAWARGWQIEARAEGGATTTVTVVTLPPHSARKLAISVVRPHPLDGIDAVEIALSLRDPAGATVHEDTVRLSVRSPADKHKRTFVSRIDGSVQYYAVTPMRRTEPDDRLPAMFLSLHGASVQGTNQAYSYAHKDWGHVVAPTNRRPFGFDWEDWGRLDALEVLALAEQRFGTDPRRTYLTGHSMGGHGTWNLGAHFPDRFAAIAPSAGWRDFWSYGASRAGGGTTVDEPDPVAALLARAANQSRTLLLERNYLHGGVYVLHGDRDDNVPVAQARFMRERLSAFHPNFAYYERPGAGHWWGNQCMDWPPLFEFLAHNTSPRLTDVRQVEFRTVNPQVSARCHWVVIAAQRAPLDVSRVDVRLDAPARRVVAETDNVARLELDLGRFAEPRTRERDGRSEDATILPAGAPLSLSIDGQDLSGVPWPDGGVLRLSFAGAWSIAGPTDPRAKNPTRAGPFKEAFQNRMLFVYGTGGTAEENAWAFDKARYDAETFWYRGNGAVEIVADRNLHDVRHQGRNLILYGNAASHAAWSRVLGDCPIRIERGAVVVGERRVAGDDLGCLFVHPRSGSDTALVAVVGGSGLGGMRATNQLPYFVSGVAYPDWIVLGADALERGVDGVRGAGFFDNDWGYAEALSAWR